MSFHSNAMHNPLKKKQKKNSQKKNKTGRNYLFRQNFYYKEKIKQ